MAKKKKSSKPQQSAAPNISQQILGEAMGGAFGVNAFYRAQAKGYSDQDIINAVRSASNYGVPVTGQLNTIAATYDSGKAAAPANFKDSGNTWQGRLMILPNRFNTSKNNAIDPYNGRFTGQRSEFEKAGGSFGYGAMNNAQWLDEKYWGTQVNSNPEIALRFNSGDTLNPNQDPNYMAKVAAEFPGNTEQLRALQALPRNYFSGLHETDPRYKEIVADKTGVKAREYLTSIDPKFAQFMGQGGKFYQSALAGAVDALPGQGAQPGRSAAQSSATPGMSNMPMAPQSSLKFKRATAKDIQRLTDYFSGQQPGSFYSMGTKSPKNLRGYDQLANYMGVKNINSKQEISRALSILGGFNNTYAAASSASKGVNYYNSLNDYLRGLGPAANKPAMATPTAPTPTAPTTTPEPSLPMTGGYGGGGGYSSDGGSSSIPKPEFSPGGASFGVDGGATSLRRKRSSRALAGLTTKGPSQFKIAGQSARSSGLNIGV